MAAEASDSAAMAGAEKDSKLMTEKTSQAPAAESHADEAGSEETATEEEEEPVVTFKTWIVVAILSSGYGISFWPIPVLTAIGQDMAMDLDNESTKYVWYIPSWTIAITTSFMLCAANTDLLGRRWFLVGGNLVSTVGQIIVTCAKSSNVVIAGLVISGFGAGNCQMAAFALPELLPNKWRHIGVVIADIAGDLSVIVAPVTGRYAFEQGHWYWNFGAGAILQFLSFLGLFFLYYPPKHPYGLPIHQLVTEIDYFGGFLFTIGVVPVLMGIVWTNVYPSSDAHVVAPLVIGFFFITCFALWERYGGVKHPLAPPHVFSSSKGRDFTAPAIALGICNMFYYSSSILWPTMINVWYTTPQQWKQSILLTLPQGFAICMGAFLLTVLGNRLRNWQWQLTGSMFIMVLFGSLMALGNPNNQSTMLAMVFLSQTGYGYAICLTIAVTQMGVTQHDLGISGGIGGVFRFGAGSIGSAIYTTILTNAVSKETVKLVPKAVMQAGLPESQVPALMKVVGTPAIATQFSPAVAAAAGEAYKQCYVEAAKLVALASMAFGIVGILASLCCKDVDHKMTNKIEVYLENDALASKNKYH